MILHEREAGDPALQDFQEEEGETACPGCSAIPDCEFVTCCNEHEVSSCAYCPEFPCDLISEFSRDKNPHHSKVLESLSLLRDQGEAAWLEEMRKFWTCPACGARTIWYQEKCDACGASWEARFK